VSDACRVSRVADELRMSFVGCVGGVLSSSLRLRFLLSGAAIGKRKPAPLPVRRLEAFMLCCWQASMVGAGQVSVLLTTV
jgi:hypothetical protein